MLMFELVCLHLRERGYEGEVAGRWGRPSGRMGSAQACERAGAAARPSVDAIMARPKQGTVRPALTDRILRSKSDARER